MLTESVVREIEAEWKLLKSSIQSGFHITRPQERALRALLNKCIAAGRAVTESADRASLQWTAREIGDVLFVATKQYHRMIIDEPGEPESPPLSHPVRDEASERQSSAK